MSYKKYKPYKGIENFKRTWPEKTITKPPFWCSVDLRDGNQSLEIPMNLKQKVEFFNYLVKVGFKEIEIGFPAASDTEFKFARELIEKNLIPEDVTIQVLTQAREHIIRKTFEALEGVKSAVVHLYNSTSTLQREVVFDNSKEETIQMAVDGANLLKTLAKEYGEERFIFQYSPESFTGTETPFAAEICNEVIKVFEPTKDKKVIINLPATVEMSTPNIYADQIEYMSNNLIERENVIISIHTHNDRGTGVAATELALLAGGDRVEGTLFGNGERTGNVDIITVALNMYTQGIDTGLNFDKIDEAIEMYEKVTNMNVHARHPYAGELVYTAFSGSHQDAIKKGMTFMNKDSKFWEVPYLPINPMDVGRSYDPIIRINSQSGKGGVAFILEQRYGFHIPKKMQQDFGLKVTEVSDSDDKELLPKEIYELFMKIYVNVESPLKLLSYKEDTNGRTKVFAKLNFDDKEIDIDGLGDGILEAFCNALIGHFGSRFEIKNYSEHSLEIGSKSRAVTYVEIIDKDDKIYYGAGISSSITKSSLHGVISAVNKMIGVS